VENPAVEDCLLTYRAELKAEALQGRAFLEMWCRLPGRGEFFSKGHKQAVSGTVDWARYEIPFYLKRGQKPDLIKLNVVVEGQGTVWCATSSCSRHRLRREEDEHYVGLCGGRLGLGFAHRAGRSCDVGAEGKRPHGQCHRGQHYTYLPHYLQPFYLMAQSGCQFPPDEAA
jgi:hypothetical protein